MASSAENSVETYTSEELDVARAIRQATSRCHCVMKPWSTYSRWAACIVFPSFLLCALLVMLVNPKYAMTITVGFLGFLVTGLLVSKALWQRYRIEPERVRRIAALGRLIEEHRVIIPELLRKQRAALEEERRLSPTAETFPANDPIVMKYAGLAPQPA